MAKGYMPLFFDTFEETENLTDEEFGRLIRAAGYYAIGKDGWGALITGNERYAFPFLKGQIDRNKSISQKRAKAGSTRKEQEVAKENKPEQNETKGNKRKQKEQDEQLMARFEMFWSAYPRHVNKQAALKAFKKINPDDAVMEIILREIERQSKSAQWTKDNGQFIPHPATWLNGNRWEDELPAESGKKTVAAQNYGQRDYNGEQADAMKRMLEGVGK